MSQDLSAFADVVLHEANVLAAKTGTIYDLPPWETPLYRETHSVL